MPTVKRLNRTWLPPKVESRGNDPFYQTKLWKQTRKQYINSHPLCEQCKKEGRTTPGKAVDHIMPIKQGGPKYSSDNLQTLCNTCHAKKSAKEKV